MDLQQLTSIRARRIVLSMIVLGLALTNGFILLVDGEWQDSGQRLGADTSYDVALADLDGDGDLDMFASNNTINGVWINQVGVQAGEAAVYVQTGQDLGLVASHGVALADLDGNQTIDAFIANSGGNEIWFNDGTVLHWPIHGQYNRRVAGAHRRPTLSSYDGKWKLSIANSSGGM